MGRAGCPSCAAAIHSHHQLLQPESCGCCPGEQLCSPSRTEALTPLPGSSAAWLVSRGFPVSRAPLRWNYSPRPTPVPGSRVSWLGRVRTHSERVAAVCPGDVGTVEIPRRRGGDQGSIPRGHDTPGATG